MVFNGVAVLAVCMWKGVGVSEMFTGLSAVTYVLIANNAAQVHVQECVCECVCVTVCVTVCVCVSFVPFTTL